MTSAPQLARRLAGLHSSAIRDLLTITARPEIISLAGGLPDPALIPRDRIRRAAEAALVDPSAVQYTETTGWAGLRDVLAARETQRLGRGVADTEVVVTHGSQQALSLLAQVLLDPGALVVVENPAYTGALQVFRTAEAQIESVPLDADGMSIDALTALLESGARPTVVHTVSNFHNPGSVSLSADRRIVLAQLADRYGFWVIEDDPYGEIWFDQAPPLPVAAHSDRVIRLSSASKILAPALRTGWLHAPEHVCRAVELVKQGVDLCGSALTQHIAADLLADDAWLTGHLETVRSAYRERSVALGRAVEQEFGDTVAATRVDGGMFCWVDFRDGTVTDALLKAAVAEGVAFVPGSAFAVGDGLENSMRLCFTTSDGPVLAEAVARLERAHATS